MVTVGNIRSQRGVHACATYSKGCVTDQKVHFYISPLKYFILHFAYNSHDFLQARYIEGTGHSEWFQPGAFDRFIYHKSLKTDSEVVCKQ